MLISLLLILLQAPEPACIWGQSIMPGRGVVNPRAEVRARSPQDSVTLRVGGTIMKVCYSRPSARGRTMIGGEAVPYGRVWRTGANEATMIHTTGHLMVAGIHLDAGTYALYTVPGENEWEIIINRSYRQWGHESTYSDSVRAQEVGRGRARVTATASPVEQFTISAAPGQGLVLEWENTRVVVPVEQMR
jgi:hypothetical protein